MNQAEPAGMDINGQPTTNTFSARARAVALLVGLGVALWALWVLQRVDATEEVASALGESRSADAAWHGIRLSAWGDPNIYGQLFTATNGHPHPKVGFWLGNSQLNTINDYQLGQQAGPHHASEALGWPMLGFMLPNANLQEHYVVLQWLFTKANPDWVILPVCFDDLREDGLRDSLKTLAPPETLAAMRQRPFGAKLGGELEGIGQQRGDSQGTTRKPRSRQQLVDEFLERQLSSRLPMWAGRGVAQARCYYALYDFRNYVFGITPSTKRKMIPARREKNMAALMEIIELVRERQVRCLVYVSPTRWDVEPPYELSDYEGWKKEVHALCQNNGVQFADLDRLVPSKQFGLFFGQLDFMHFGPEGHELIGRKVASLIQASP